MVNNLKALFLIVFLSGILLMIGGLVGGTSGLIIALIFALAMNIGSYWFSDKLALKMTGAREVTADQEPQLHRVVEEVSAMAGLPKPRVYVIQNDSRTPSRRAATPSTPPSPRRQGSCASWTRTS